MWRQQGEHSFISCPKFQLALKGTTEKARLVGQEKGEVS